MLSIDSISPANWLKIAFISVVLALLSGLVLSGYRISISITNANAGKTPTPAASIPPAAVAASAPKVKAAPGVEAKPDPSAQHQGISAAPPGILDAKVKFAVLAHFDDIDDSRLQSDTRLPPAIAPSQILDPEWKGNAP